MPKTMAVIENNIVTNLIWCEDSSEETDEIKEVFEKKVQIGDSYQDGEFYRDGERVRSAMQELEDMVFDLREQLSTSYTEEELLEAYNSGVNSI